MEVSRNNGHSIQWRCDPEVRYIESGLYTVWNIVDVFFGDVTSDVTMLSLIYMFLVNYRLDN